MWRPYVVSSDARSFDLAFEGRPAGEAAELLARFAREFSAAAGFAPVEASERGRARLMAAVAARREERRYRAVAPLSVRGGSIVAATVAGGGLLVAAAANATDSLAFVKLAVNEVASAVHIPQVFREPELAASGAAHEVVIVGIIAAFAEGEPTFIVDSDGALERVRLQADTLLRYDDGTPVGRVALGVGTSVRVRGVREGVGRIEALLIELPRRGPEGSAPPALQPTAPGEPEELSNIASADGTASADDETSASSTAAPRRATPTPATGTPAPGARRTETAIPTAVSTRTPDVPVREPEPFPLPTLGPAPMPTATPVRSTATPVPTRVVDTPTPTPKPTDTPAPVPTSKTASPVPTLKADVATAVTTDSAAARY